MTTPPGTRWILSQVEFLTGSAAAGWGGKRLEDLSIVKNRRMEQSRNTCRVANCLQEAASGGRDITRPARMLGVTGFDLRVGPGKRRRVPLTSDRSGPYSVGDGTHSPRLLWCVRRADRYWRSESALEHLENMSQLAYKTTSSAVGGECRIPISAANSA